MDCQEIRKHTENPFIPERPALNSSEFIGRQDAFGAIRNALGNSPVSNPMVISGPPGIGKTSLLSQLDDGALGNEVGVLYADFRDMDTSSLSRFSWQLAKAIMTAMDKQGLATPTIEKRMLVLNPQLVFRQRFWSPLLVRAQSTPLLLAWDNFDVLARQDRGDHNLQSLRAYLYSLLETDAPIDLLLSITGRIEALGSSSLAPFHLTKGHRLTALDKEQTLCLMRRSNKMAVSGSVADYIFQLTAGHPGDTQRLCHSLHDRHIRRGHQQVTVADVMAVLKQELGPKDFNGALYDRLDRSISTGA